MNALTYHFMLKEPISPKGWLKVKEALGEEYEGKVRAEFYDGFAYAIFTDCEATALHVKLLLP